MDFSQENVVVNLGKVKHDLMKEIASELIENDGTIFGGYVRDTMIHDHSAALFYEKYHYTQENKKYSDPTFDPETVARLLVPKDIDVFFSEGAKPVKEILEKLKKPDREIDYIYVTSVYLSDKKVKHIKATIRFPFLTSILRKNIEVNLDILHSKRDVVPPFGQCDMECNAFLMDQRGIHLSTHTGSLNLDFFPVTGMQRKKEEIRIIDELLEFKTRVFQFSKYDVKMEKMDIKHRQRMVGRIINMLSRGWTIINLPFFSVYRFGNKISTVENKKELDCKICLEEIPHQQTVFKLNCCDINVDANCLRKYLKDELEERITPRCINACKLRERGWNIFTHKV